jgi:hypothetical protein
LLGIEFVPASFPGVGKTAPVADAGEGCGADGLRSAMSVLWFKIAATGRSSPGGFPATISRTNGSNTGMEPVTPFRMLVPAEGLTWEAVSAPTTYWLDIWSTMAETISLIWAGAAPTAALVMR